jgi:hypothetical protein
VLPIGRPRSPKQTKTIFDYYIAHKLPFKVLESDDADNCAAESKPPA